MIEDEKRQALENIGLIKDIVTQTNKEMSLSRGGWISIIWGIFCLVGFAGQKLLSIFGLSRVLYWTILAIIGSLATFLVVKSRLKTQSQKIRGYFIRGFFLFWIPLIVLAYTITALCIYLPDLHSKYIPIFIMLVISTGFLIIGFLFTKEILIMGTIGFVGTVLTAIFFLEYADLALGLLFGVGLIVTGLISNLKWKEQI
ncbi:MAG: hypothetical protein GTN73_09300 [Candidatus Aminicenantes bacterium]|nr:hypothetical protein [Candidatus Aminicenantes bacterium]